MDEVRAAGLKVAGISFDSVEENLAFAEKFGFPYPLLCDADRSVGLDYGAARTADEGYAKRISYVIDEEGKVLLVYAQVVPSEHLDTILRDLGS